MKISLGRGTRTLQYSHHQILDASGSHLVSKVASYDEIRDSVYSRGSSGAGKNKSLVTVGHTTLHDPTPSELASVSDHERNREFASDMRRQQYLCGRSLLRRMLEDWTGIQAASHELTLTEAGKPVCVEGPAISITHSGDRIACGIAESGDIGIDLEVINDRRDPEKLAKKFFSREESDWLGTQPTNRFFMLWVLKEAYVKAIGRSIFGGINRLRCTVVPPGIDVIAVSDRMHDLRLYKSEDSLLALAATEVSLADVSIRRWDADANELLTSEEFHLLASSRDPFKM